MAKFILSAFADEYSPNFDEQIEGLKLNGLNYMEIRGVDGKNISAVTTDEAKQLKAKLDKNGIAVSSMGSPLGKIAVGDPLEPHLDQLSHMLDLAEIFECDRIRMFSFYTPKGENPYASRSRVMFRLGKMLAMAQSRGVKLCHENEKGIYGDNAERCLDIHNEFDGGIKLIFDHANFVCCDVEPFPYAFEMLKEHIYYLHIKDANADKTMAPAGEGVGRIPETMKALAANNRTYFLTVEPHLRVFKGLDKLEGANDLKFEKRYESSAAAFKAAVDAIKAHI